MSLNCLQLVNSNHIKSKIKQKPCVRETPAVWHEQTGGVWGCCTSWSYDPDDRRCSAPLQQSVHKQNVLQRSVKHKSGAESHCVERRESSKTCLLYFIQFKFKLPLNASLTHLLFSSHLCILSKEPVLVTTLHSQQSILMLLFQLDHLLLKGGENALWTPGGGATVQWRTQLCTLSSSCLGKLREVNSLQE